MRLAILSDAHANGPALARCLHFLRGHAVDQVLFLGDAVGYLPCGPAVCRQLERAGVICLMGNHEAMCFGELPVPPDKEAIMHLPREDALPRAWVGRVRDNGPRLDLELAGRRLTLMHGSPVDPLQGYAHDPASLSSDDLEQIDADAIIMGHTHRPFIAHSHGRLLLNPGSCGLPRDAGNLLSLAVLDLETMQARVYRLPFAHSQALARRSHPDVAACLARCNPAFGERVEAGV